MMFMLQKWYSKNKALRLEVCRIIDILRENNVDLAAYYINTAENVLADALSRVVDEKRISLCTKFVDLCMKEGLIDKIVSHERLENTGDNVSLEQATWKYRQYV